jgi:hypothetical protein
MTKEGVGIRSCLRYGFVGVEVALCVSNIAFFLRPYANVNAVKRADARQTNETLDFEIAPARVKKLFHIKGCGKVDRHLSFAVFLRLL